MSQFIHLVTDDLRQSCIKKKLFGQADTSFMTWPFLVGIGSRRDSC